MKKKIIILSFLISFVTCAEYNFCYRFDWGVYRPDRLSPALPNVGDTAQIYVVDVGPNGVFDSTVAMSDLYPNFDDSVLSVSTYTNNGGLYDDYITGATQCIQASYGSGQIVIVVVVGPLHYVSPVFNVPDIPIASTPHLISADGGEPAYMTTTLLTLEFSANVTVLGNGTVNYWSSFAGDSAVTNDVWYGGAELTFEALPDDGWLFSEWSGDLVGTSATTNIIADYVDMNVTATFVEAPELDFDLTVSVVGNGTVSHSSGTYSANTNLVLEATPDEGWLFMGWSGDLVASYESVSLLLLLNEDKNITATFSDDADGDGLTNIQEIRVGSSPREGEALIDLYNLVSNRVTMSEAQAVMRDLRPGSQTIGVSNGMATVRLYLDESSDLTTNWSPRAEFMEVQIPATNDVQFFRIRMD